MGLNDWLLLLGALGGLEGMRWLVTFLVNRKTDARKEEATVDSMEDENQRNQVDWLEKRLSERDAKIDSLYVELRQEQSAKLDEIYRRHEVELKLKEMETKRCDVKGCTNRIPPGDY